MWRMLSQSSCKTYFWKLGEIVPEHSSKNSLLSVSKSQKITIHSFSIYHTELDSGNTRVSTTGSVPARTPTPYNSGGGLSAGQQPLCTAHVVTVSLSSCPLRVSRLVTELVQSTKPALTRWVEQHHIVSCIQMSLVAKNGRDPLCSLVKLKAAGCAHCGPLEQKTVYARLKLSDDTQRQQTWPIRHYMKGVCLVRLSLASYQIQ